MKFIVVIILAMSVFHTYFAVKKLISGKGMVKLSSPDEALDRKVVFQD